MLTTFSFYNNIVLTGGKTFAQLIL